MKNVQMTYKTPERKQLTETEVKYLQLTIQIKTDFLIYSNMIKQLKKEVETGKDIDGNKLSQSAKDQRSSFIGAAQNFLQTLNKLLKF